MPLHSPRNEYAGVNAHLHSFYQSHGGWEGFHGKHVGDMAELITPLLPRGYVVDIEQSLQLREIHPDTGERIRRPQPDLTLFQAAVVEPHSVGAISSSSAVATLTQPVARTIYLQERLHYSALLILRVDDSLALGKPITRIELLSPSNKYGVGFIEYSEKRLLALKSGVRLVEIDYLHETDPVVVGVPSYARGEAGSHAYTITINDPNPDMDAGLATTFGFDVDVAIPTLDIPLDAGKSFALDFNAAYNKTFNSLSAFSLRVDYARPPEHFDSYHAADQARILARMATVAAAAP